MRKAVKKKKTAFANLVLRQKVLGRIFLKNCKSQMPNINLKPQIYIFWLIKIFISVLKISEDCKITIQTFFYLFKNQKVTVGFKVPLFLRCTLLIVRVGHRKISKLRLVCKKNLLKNFYFRWNSPMQMFVLSHFCCSIAKKYWEWKYACKAFTKYD